MSSTTLRCDRIITLIDACLADYDESRRPTRSAAGVAAPVPAASRPAG